MKKLLLPIRPKYVEQIFVGNKRVEYRTRIRKDFTVNQVLIYQSFDVRKIVGEFRISGIIKGTPEEVWCKTNHIGGINKEDYFKYFSKSDVAYAYQIEDLVIFEKPMALSEFGLNKAPMSFQYVYI